MLKIPNRNIKPRKFGITSTHDVGIPLMELRQILESYSDFIDVAKFGVGSALVEPFLKEKIDLYKSFNIEVYFGGTLFEKYFYQNKLEEYLDFLRTNDVSSLEISTGTLDIPIESRIKLVKKLKNEFNIFSEVGSKDGNSIMSPKQWINEINELLNAGCKYVITEGRNSESSGIYHSSGELRKDLILNIIDSVDVNKIIFEAPKGKTQMFFINSVGSNVNLGNVNPRDLLLLESQRRSLRSETFFNE